MTKKERQAIEAAMQQNVQDGLAKVVKVGKDGPTWSMTDAGREHAEELFAGVYGMTREVFMSISEVPRKRLIEIALFLIANDMTLEDCGPKSQ